MLADFNGDGREDFVVASFGNTEGGLSWYENKGGGKLEEHSLFAQPGALRPQVGDFNRDGHPDIAVLVAHHWNLEPALAWVGVTVDGQLQLGGGVW